MMRRSTHSHPTAKASLHRSLRLLHVFSPPNGCGPHTQYTTPRLYASGYASIVYRVLYAKNSRANETNERVDNRPWDAVKNAILLMFANLGAMQLLAGVATHWFMQWSTGPFTCVSIVRSLSTTTETLLAYSTRTLHVLYTYSTSNIHVPYT